MFGRDKAGIEHLRSLIEEWVKELGLEVHPEKTKVVDLRKDGLDLVGYQFSQRGAVAPVDRAGAIAKRIEAEQSARRRHDVVRGVLANYDMGDVADLLQPSKPSSRRRRQKSGGAQLIANDAGFMDDVTKRGWNCN